MDPIGIVRLGDENFEFPIMEGAEAERAIDLRTLRSKTGYIAFDEGYGNTGSCESGITFINGEKGKGSSGGSVRGKRSFIKKLQTYFLCVLMIK